MGQLLYRVQTPRPVGITNRATHEYTHTHTHAVISNGQCCMETPPSFKEELWGGGNCTMIQKSVGGVIIAPVNNCMVKKESTV